MPPTEPFNVSRTVVPWMSRLEWDEVRRKIFSSNLDDSIWAINRIGIWKMRVFSKIPVGIEVTTALVRAAIMDMQNPSHYGTGNITMMYGMALIRFINLLTEMAQPGKNVAIHVAAERLGIPEWIVNIRHQIAHQTCPSLTSLRIATREALIWIENNYWKEETNKMFDETHSRLSKNTHADFDLARTLLNEYRNHQSKGEKSRNNMMEAVERFKELLSKNSEVICILLKKGFLFPDKKTSVNKKRKSFSLPFAFSLWSLILQTVMETGNITLFHEKMIYNLATDDECYSTCILNWLLPILNANRTEDQESSLAASDSVTEFINCCSQMCNWAVLLRAAIQTPNTSTVKILPLLMERSGDILSKKQQDQIKGLMSAYCETNVRFVLDVIGPNDYQTVDTLRSLNPLDDNDEDDVWNPYQDSLDWSHYPIGILPHQIGAKILDLDLPIEIDELHQHDFPAWSAPASLQNQTEMESDEEIIAKPDLEARLLISRHAKGPSEWSHQHLQDVMNKINII